LTALFPPMLKKYAVLVTLAAILALGAFLRFHKLEFNSFWLDEASSYYTSNAPFSRVLGNLKSFDIHPPAYFLMLSRVIRYFGNSETALRFPSAAAGVLVIPAMFLLGRRLYSEKEGLIAAALTAVSWSAVSLSREARAYEFLLLFTILSFYFLISLLRALKENSDLPTGSAAGYILCAVINSYLHYYGAYIIFLQALACLWLSRKKPPFFRAFLVFYLSILVCYLPWLPSFIYQARHNRGNIAWLGNRNVLYEFFRYSFGVLHSKSAFIALLAPFFFFLFSFLRGAFKHKEPARGFSFANPDFFVLCWLTVPFALLYAESAVALPILGTRYLIIIFPAACLIFARSITLLPLRAVYTSLVSILAVYLLLFNMVIVEKFYAEPCFPQVREPVKLMAALGPRFQNSLIILRAAAYMRIDVDYYFERLSIKKDYIDTEWNKDDAERIAKIIRESKPEYVWLLNAGNAPGTGGAFEGYFSRDKLLLSRQYYQTGVELRKLAYPRG